MPKARTPLDVARYEELKSQGLSQRQITKELGIAESTLRDNLSRTICRAYFPQWRQATTWTIKPGARGQYRDAQGMTLATSEAGYCDDQTKTIWVQARDTAIIIHEICHAVTGGGHGKTWQAHLAAARRAAALGDQGLAAALTEEVAGYAAAPPITARTIYRRVPDVLVDTPNVTFAHLVDYLAYDYGLTGPELLAKCSRLQTVFEQARRQEMRSLRAEIKTWTAYGKAPQLLAPLTQWLQALEAAST